MKILIYLAEEHAQGKTVCEKTFRIFLAIHETLNVFFNLLTFQTSP